MITRIEAYRYRCFEKLSVDFGHYQVLVGRNGAGKSTLLDIPVLIGEMLETRNIQKVFFGERDRLAPRASSVQDLVFSRKGDWFSLAIEVQLPEFESEKLERKHVEYLGKREIAARERDPGRSVGFLRYELGFRVGDGDVKISHEYLFLLPKSRALLGDTPAGLWGDSVGFDSDLAHAIIRRGADNVSLFHPEAGRRTEATPANIPDSIPALSGVPLDLRLYAASDWMRNYLGRDVLPVNLNLAAMRAPQRPVGPAFKVALDGTTLPWSVLGLEKKDASHREWLDHIGSAIPFLKDVRGRVQEADNHAYLEVTYDTEYSVRSTGLSDGTLTLLALSILPFLDNVPSFVAVEEPENGIHPKAIEVILESLRVMEDSQAVVTTHSPIVVAVTKPENLLCLSITKNEGVKVVRGSEHPTLKKWEGIPGLDVLFSAGVL
jgi:hypothetical protein